MQFPSFSSPLDGASRRGPARGPRGDPTPLRGGTHSASLYSSTTDFAPFSRGSFFGAREEEHDGTMTKLGAVVTRRGSVLPLLDVAA